MGENSDIGLSFTMYTSYKLTPAGANSSTVGSNNSAVMAHSSTRGTTNLYQTTIILFINQLALLTQKLINYGITGLYSSQQESDTAKITV